jgi:hypothetical protein
MFGAALETGIAGRFFTLKRGFHKPLQRLHELLAVRPIHQANDLREALHALNFDSIEQSPALIREYDFRLAAVGSAGVPLHQAFANHAFYQHRGGRLAHTQSAGDASDGARAVVRNVPERLILGSRDFVCGAVRKARRHDLKHDPGEDVRYVLCLAQEILVFHGSPPGSDNGIII